MRKNSRDSAILSVDFMRGGRVVRDAEFSLPLADRRAAANGCVVRYAQHLSRIEFRLSVMSVPLADRRAVTVPTSASRAPLTD